MNIPKRYKTKKEVFITDLQIDSEITGKLLRYKNRVWQINDEIAAVTELLREGATVEEVCDSGVCTSTAPGEETRESVIELLDFFEEEGLLEGTQDAKTGTKSMMWLHFTVLPQKLVNRIRCFTFLFRPFVYPVFFCFGIGWVLLFLFLNSTKSIAQSAATMTLHDIVIVMAVSVGITVFHEIGHTSALLAYGGTPGAIGAGINFIMPVAYSDMSDSWSLTRKQRISVDYGGIYFQLILTGILFIAYMATNSRFLYYLVLGSLSTAFINFSPALEMDGHWMICDSLGVFDPWGEARRVFISKEAKDEYSTWKKAVLLLYVLMGLFITGYFTVTMIQMAAYMTAEIITAIRDISQNGLPTITLRTLIGTINSHFMYIIATVGLVIFATRIIKSIIKAVKQKTSKKQNQES